MNSAAQIGQAIGGPAQVAGKLGRISDSIQVRLNPRELDRRLTRLQTLGVVDVKPTHLQLRFAGMDMLRFCILPAAKAYYDTQGINMSFHYFLRFLEDPMSMLDPIGLSTTKDTLVGHLLQSVHLNPVYDLQLLCMFDDGLEDLEMQAHEIIKGSHKRQQSIAATVEDTGYHRRLLDFIKAFRKDPAAEPPLRDVGNLRENQLFLLAEATFHTLPAFLRYADRLPTSFIALVKHRQTTQLDPAYCDRDAVSSLMNSHDLPKDN